jgi:hypothetical protein
MYVHGAELWNQMAAESERSETRRRRVPFGPCVSTRFPSSRRRVCSVLLIRGEGNAGAAFVLCNGRPV